MAQAAAAAQQRYNFAGEVEMVDIETLRPDPTNPNVREDVEDIRASLAEFGQHKPIVAKRDGGRIIIGNHTWQAARSEGWTQVQALLVDDDDLKAMRRGLADNRIGERRQFLDPVLKAMLDEAGEDIPGFDEEYMSDLLGRVSPPTLDDVEEEHGEPEEDDFWAVIRIKLPPEIKMIWDTHVAQHESDLAALKALLDID